MILLSTGTVVVVVGAGVVVVVGAGVVVVVGAGVVVVVGAGVVVVGFGHAISSCLSVRVKVFLVSYWEPSGRRIVSPQLERRNFRLL